MHLKSIFFSCLCKQLLANHTRVHTEENPVHLTWLKWTQLDTLGELRCLSSSYQNSDFSWTAMSDSCPKYQHRHWCCPWAGWGRAQSRAAVPLTAAFFDGFAVAAAQLLVRVKDSLRQCSSQGGLVADSHYTSANTAELVTTTPRSNLFPLKNHTYIS